MKLKDALFRTPEALYEVTTSYLDRDDDQYLDWDLTAIGEQKRGERRDGFFIAKGLVVSGAGEPESAYIEISMPEGITQHIYVLEGEQIVRKGQMPKWLGRQKVIPATVIRGVIDQEVYYARGNPDVGLSILRRGLSEAEAPDERHAFSRMMGIILRCEGRYQEAEEAYTIAIGSAPKYLLQYNYIDRAFVRERLGDLPGAASDREAAEKLLPPKRPTACGLKGK